MPIKLGTVIKKLPYKKIYLGNQIKYWKKEWVLKTGNFIPTFLEGELNHNGFIITHSDLYTEESTLPTRLYRIFDNDTSTGASIIHNTDYRKGNDFSIVLEFNRIIQPTIINIKLIRSSNTSTFSLDLSLDGSNYNTVHSHTLDSGVSEYTYEKTITIAPNQYKFLRLRYTPSNATVDYYHPIYHCQITEWYEEE